MQNAVCISCVDMAKVKVKRFVKCERPQQTELQQQRQVLFPSLDEISDKFAV